VTARASATVAGADAARAVLKGYLPEAATDAGVGADG
jgi:hypothetical protein